MCWHKYFRFVVPLYILWHYVIYVYIMLHSFRSLCDIVYALINKEGTQFAIAYYFYVI